MCHTPINIVNSQAINEQRVAHEGPFLELSVYSLSPTLIVMQISAAFSLGRTKRLSDRYTPEKSSNSSRSEIQPYEALQPALKEINHPPTQPEH